MLTADEFNARVAALMKRSLFSGSYLDLTFPPGWLGLIERVVADLEALPGGEALRCRQLKVKWWRLRLRVYRECSARPDDPCHPPDGELDQRAETRILQAEDEAATLCYLCGRSISTHGCDQALPLCGEHQATDVHEMLTGYQTFKAGDQSDRF